MMAVALDVRSVIDGDYLKLSRGPARAVLVASSVCALTGCRLSATPSFALFGAYFPAWMLCGLAGIIAAAGAGALLRSGRLSQLPYQFIVCCACGVLVSTIVWLVVFG
jgi:YtcA family